MDPKSSLSRVQPDKQPAVIAAQFCDWLVVGIPGMGIRRCKGNGLQVKSEQGVVSASGVRIDTCGNLQHASPSWFQGGVFDVLLMVEGTQICMIRRLDRASAVSFGVERKGESLARSSDEALIPKYVV